MSFQIILLAEVIILVTHYIGAITVYGSTLLALPLLMWVIGDLDLAVMVLLLVGTLQAYQIVALTWRHIDWKECGRMFAWSAPAMIPGMIAPHVLPRSITMTVLAAVLLAAGISRLFKTHTEKPLPRWAGIGLLLAAGLIHGAFACGGAALVVYAQYTFKDKNTFRATMCVFWVIVNTALIIARLCTQLPGADGLVLTGIAVPIVLVAGWLGNRTAGRMPQSAFIRLVAVMLILSGAVTLQRAWGG